MSNSDVYRVLRQVVSEEFADIPNEDEIEYEFSKRFEKKMQRLLRRVGKKSFGKRRLAVIIAAVIIITAMLSMSVSAIREPIVRFVIEAYDGFFDLNFEGNLSNKIGQRYEITYIPDKFEEVRRFEGEGFRQIIYENKVTGDKMGFEQSGTKDNSISVDTEHTIITEKIINDNQVYICVHESGEPAIANWVEETYYMNLYCYGNIDIDEFIKIIESIK